MVFWILVVVIGVIALGVTAFQLWDWGEVLLPVMMGVITALIGAVVGSVILLLFTLIPAGHVSAHTYTLRALGNQSAAQGEFFLGSGYIDGSQEFSYIQQNNGYFVLQTADASSSRVFEDATTKPTVIQYTEYYSNGWVIPWNFDGGTTYDFHVPRGTVQSNYVVSTSK